MKRLIYTFLLLIGCLTSHAQTEGGNTLQDHSQVKDFGGFILDMASMLNAESLVLSPLAFPTLSYLTPVPEVPMLQVNPEAFKISPFSTSALPSSTNGVSNMRMNWQGKSYKLNNGMRFNMYGDYNADGYKVYNPSALPWERNNFNAAFEMKSASGNFGIKVEVHGGRNNPY